MNAPHRNRYKPFFHQWIIHVTMLFALAGFIAYTQYQEYHRIDNQEQERLSTQAETLEKNVTSQLLLANRVIDSVMRELPTWQAEGAGLRRADHQLKLINDTLIGIHPILLIGADGKVLASSEKASSSDDFFLSDCFKEARQHPDSAQLHFSGPVPAQHSDREISLCRTVRGPQREFEGVVMVRLLPEYFSGLLNSVRYAPDVTSIIARNGGELYMVASQRAAGALMGAGRMAAGRTAKVGAVGETVLQLAVSRDLGTLFAPWRRGLYAQSILFIVIAAISTLGLLRVQKRHHTQRLERKKAERKIQQLAFFDQLTKLPNRILLLDRLKQAMKASVRSGNYGAILFIDLDNFKTLNDTLGHDMGDLLLNQVAQRLNACVRAGDTVARLGGDEFVVMLTGLHSQAEEAAHQVDIIGTKILEELSQTYRLNQVSHSSTSSIGATLFLGNLSTIDDLLKQADLAMYKSKAVGRNALRFFDPAMEVTMLERAALETDLRDAILCDQLLLHYQPQIDRDGHITGVEALVRWRHPVRGLVPPADFIPLAEEIGVIMPLGQWVLETACRQLLAWADRSDTRHLTIAVNVSVRQFSQDDFVDQVLRILATTGADPHCLKLELTESLLVSDVGDVIAKMSALKARGVGFSLDDFGTGYSSLAYLQRLPLDQLKIDQSFVRDVVDDQSGASIARTIIALAKSLHIDVIAEGVETGAQRDFLASSGCHAYQGYYFSRPLPLDELEQFVLKAPLHADSSRAAASAPPTAY